MPMTDEQKAELRAALEAVVTQHLESGAGDEVIREQVRLFLADQNKDGLGQRKVRTIKDIRDEFNVEPGIVSARLLRATFLADQKGGGEEAVIDQLKTWAKHDRYFGGEFDQRIIDLYEASWSGVDKALISSELEAGAAIVPPMFSDEIIEFLRSNTVVRAMGARTIPLTTGTLTMPRHTGTVSGGYIGELENAPVSQLTLGQLRFVLRKLAAVVAISNDLIRDSSNAIDMLVRDDLSQSLRVTEDLQFLRGLGGEHAPTGIRNLVDPSHKFAAHDTNGLELKDVKDDLTLMIQRVVESDIPMTRPGFVVNPRTERFLKNMGDTRGWWYAREMRENKTIEGYPYMCTTQIPSTLGTSSLGSEVYFGDFAQVLIGEGMGLAIEAARNGAYHDGSKVVAGFSNDTSAIRAIARHDIKLRYDKAFAVLTDVKWDTQP